jgi:hypothetical protein
LQISNPESVIIKLEKEKTLYIKRTKRALIRTEAFLEKTLRIHAVCRKKTKAVCQKERGVFANRRHKISLGILFSSKKLSHPKKDFPSAS